MTTPAPKRTPKQIWKDVLALLDELEAVGGLQPALSTPVKPASPPFVMPAPPPFPGISPLYPTMPPLKTLPGSNAPWDLPGLNRPREEVCAVTQFFKQNPNAKSAMISCTCPYCSVHC